MTETDKLYYGEMLRRNRLLPFFDDNDNLRCFITYFIGDKDAESKFIRNNPWSVVEDYEDKDVMWVDQMWSDKKAINHRYSFEVWNKFISFIKINYPNVKQINWNRWKNEKLYKFRLKI